MGSTVVRNLPVVLFSCGAYFVFFSALWGPLAPWKIVVAAGILVGLCLGLDLQDSWGRVGRARRRVPENARWPLWRRGGAILAGVLVCLAGLYQATGREVDVGGRYPLLSGLCVVVSLAVGILLIARAWPQQPWRRRIPPHAQRPDSRDAKRSRRKPVHAGGSSIPVPAPRDLGFSGVWGGFGSRPAHPIWRPCGTSATDGPAEPVPRRFRLLHLRRRRRSHEEPAPVFAKVLLGLLALGMLASLAYALLR
jgi:hypothetical protein